MRHPLAITPDSHMDAKTEAHFDKAKQLLEACRNRGQPDAVLVGALQDRLKVGEIAYNGIFDIGMLLRAVNCLIAGDEMVWAGKDRDEVPL